jgi:hypothetical protein
MIAPLDARSFQRRDHTPICAAIAAGIHDQILRACLRARPAQRAIEEDRAARLLFRRDGECAGFDDDPVCSGRVTPGSNAVGVRRRHGELRSDLQQRFWRRQRADDDGGARGDIAAVARHFPTGLAMIPAAPREQVVSNDAVPGPHEIRGHGRAHDA